RNALFKMDAHTAVDLEFAEKQTRCLHGEVVVAGGQGGVGAGEVDVARLQLDLDFIRQRDRRHERLQLVKAVGPLAQDVEIEIDLGRGGLFHRGKPELEDTHAPMATDKLIVALDVNTAAEALALVRKLKASLSCFKVGSQLFTREGPALVRALREREHVDVFLDLKFHDIPQTVAKAVGSAAALGVRFLTLHTSGGAAMMRAAADAAQGTSVQLLGVTVLTSFDESGLRAVGFERPLADQALRLARLAVENSVPGLVCSPLEIALLRGELGTSVTL